MKRKTLIVLSALLISSALAEVPDADVLRVSDGKTISFDRMVHDVKKADIVFVGEVHGVPEHHRLELEIIKAFHESDTPLVIGLEMFKADNQSALDAWVAEKSTVEQFLFVYYDNWREPWPFYRDIFLYVREHRIPTIGLNIPDDISQTVARKGFESLSSEQKKRLPPGISCTLDPTYMDFIKKAYAGHPGEGGEDRRFFHFCEAQMVWDKAMAWQIIAYLKKYPGRTMVVLAGVGHAWKRGIPAQVAELSKLKYAVVMPEVPDQIEQKTVTQHDADYVVLD